MDDLTEEEYYSVVTAIAPAITYYAYPVIQHDSTLTGKAIELMATYSWSRFHDVLRMEKHAFIYFIIFKKLLENYKAMNIRMLGKANYINTCFGCILESSTNRAMATLWLHCQLVYT